MSEAISGIYRIVCVKNGRYYFGSSKNIYRRWITHKSALRLRKHRNPIIQRSWNKHGESSFRIELIEQTLEEKLLEVENIYLKKHVGKSNCMNIALDAAAPMRGKARPDIRGDNNPTKRPEIREKMRGPRPSMCGSNNPNAKLILDNISEIVRLYGNGWTQQKIANWFQISQPHVSRILRNNHE